MTITRGLIVAGLMGVLLSVASAQTTTATSQSKSTTVERYSENGRWYLVKLDGEERFQQGGWGRGDQLRKYAAANPGAYILFVQNGSVHKLSDAKQLKEIAALYEPLRQLSKQQEALSSVQRPLGEQQRALGEQQRATQDPATQGQIGAVQGSVGKVQGEIGRQQGVIGKQQGLLGSSLNDHVQAMIDACLKDKSCPVVEAAKT